MVIAFTLVEAIGRNSNLAGMSNKWHELRKRIDESLPRQTLLYQDKPKTRSKRFLTTEDTAEIVSRYQAGDTTQAIGSSYGISKTRVATILRKQGITIRRQGLTDEQVREAAELYATGKSLAWLGARFGVSHTTVRAAFQQKGIQVRPRPGWN